MVCHETYRDKDNNWLSPDEIEIRDDNFSKKMTQVTKLKSAPESIQIKNVIDPENMINNYGADAVRLFILSDSPPEKDIQWFIRHVVSNNLFKNFGLYMSK